MEIYLPREQEDQLTHQLRLSQVLIASIVQ